MSAQRDVPRRASDTASRCTERSIGAHLPRYEDRADDSCGVGGVWPYVFGIVFIVVALVALFATMHAWRLLSSAARSVLH